MRNKKWAMPFLQEKKDLIIFEPMEKGNWKNLLKKDIINIEIGFGKGSYIEQMSKIHENIGWIGIERDINCAAVAAKRIVEDQPNNLKMIVNDAEDLKEWFDEKEVNNIYLNFSDPWPKKRNTKRRLTSSSFIEQYASILKDDGRIIMKTDNRKLFEFSVLSFLQNGFDLEYINVDFRKELQDDPITEYENRFMEANQPIYRFIVHKHGG